MAEREHGAAASVGAALIAALLASAPASAHSAFGSAAPFWSGALHVAVSPLAIAAIVGLGAAVAFASNDRILQAATLAAALAALAASLLPPGLGVYVAPLGALVVGLAAALGGGDSPLQSPLLGALAGLSIGASAELDSRTWSAALGAGFATLIAVIWAVEILARSRGRLPLARRVIGAWVAAIALLLGALALQSAG